MKKKLILQQLFKLVLDVVIGVNVLVRKDKMMVLAVKPVPVTFLPIFVERVEVRVYLFLRERVHLRVDSEMKDTHFVCRVLVMKRRRPILWIFSESSDAFFDVTSRRTELRWNQEDSHSLHFPERKMQIVH
jgi:hypothetical protein